MAVFIAFLVAFLAMTGHSSANYCLCKDGVATDQLQKNIDYACGNGGNCAQILQNGACYNPNTVKDHCNYAVNSYYQAKQQAPLSCDFSGSATVSPNPPPTASSTCTYPSSAGAVGSTNNSSSTTPGSTAPTNPNPPTTLTPGGSTGGTTNSPNFGGGSLGPSGTSITNPDGTGGSSGNSHNSLASVAATFFLTALICLRI